MYKYLLKGDSIEAAILLQLLALNSSGSVDPTRRLTPIGLLQSPHARN